MSGPGHLADLNRLVADVCSWGESGQNAAGEPELIGPEWDGFTHRLSY
jgi:hypothetical protein